jgi:hypothetical protein
VSVKQNFGKPWKNESFHATFDEADITRNKLLAIWSDNEAHKGMQVKVRRLSDRYVVKTRLHPDSEPKEEKKHGKGKRRNKKAPIRRKLDTSSAI